MTTQERETQAQIRVIISSVYDLQKLRISMGNRLIQSFYIQMGIKPGEKIDSADKDCKGMLDNICKEHKRLADAVSENNISIKKQIVKSLGENNLSYIKTDIDFKLVAQYISLLKNEEETTKVLKTYVEQHPMWNLFFKNVKGCGVLMTANCLAYLNIEVARHASSFHKYCGLDTVSTVNEDGLPMLDEDGNLVLHGRKRTDTEDRDYIKKDGSDGIKKGLTYNPDLRSKLIGVLGSGFLKCPGSQYDLVYRGYRARLDNMPKHDNKSAGHKHNMSIRYCVKQFLTDMWVVWREQAGLEVTESYAVAVLGRQPHGYNNTAM